MRWVIRRSIMDNARDGAADGEDFAKGRKNTYNPEDRECEGGASPPDSPLPASVIDGPMPATKPILIVDSDSDVLVVEEEDSFEGSVTVSDDDRGKAGGNPPRAKRSKTGGK